MRAFQFFNLNKEEDRQEFLALASNFLDKLIGGDTRGMANGMANGMGNGNLFGILGNIFDLLDNIFGRRALMPDEYNFDQSYPQMMERKIEIETILGLLPEFILQKIADFVETPCKFAKLFAADNELLGDACEFFQNLDE